MIKTLTTLKIADRYMRNLVRISTSIQPNHLYFNILELVIMKCRNGSYFRHIIYGKKLLDSTQFFPTVFNFSTF